MYHSITRVKSRNSPEGFIGKIYFGHIFLFFKINSTFITTLSCLFYVALGAKFCDLFSRLKRMSAFQKKKKIGSGIVCGARGSQQGTIIRAHGKPGKSWNFPDLECHGIQVLVIGNYEVI